MLPPVSACMVIYRSGDAAKTALRCIDDADMPVQVFVCDNSPNEPLADQLKWEFPGITVLSSTENIGYGRANNLVLPYLNSKYHLILNPDVVFAPALISRMIEYMESHPNVAVLTPRVLNPDETEQFLPKKQISVHYLLGGLFEKAGGVFRKWRDEFTMADMDIRTPVSVEFATGCFLLIRTEVFRALGGFDPRFFLYQEDSDLSRRILEKRLGSIVYHPQMVITHAWSRENTRTSAGRFRQMRSVAKYFLKWGVAW